MEEIYLTAKSLYSICKDECERHGVCFHYVYDKVLSLTPLPVTRNQLLAEIEEILVAAFWLDYDHLYQGVSYPEYATKKISKHIH